MKLKAPAVPHTIRFPGGLYEEIQLFKSRSSRTFNGAVVYLLQIGLAVAKRYDESINKVLENENVNSGEAEKDGQ